MREIYKPKAATRDPRVSPDGQNVAFIEGLMRTRVPPAGDIYLFPIGGGAVRNLTPEIKGVPYALAWAAPDRFNFR